MIKKEGRLAVKRPATGGMDQAAQQPAGKWRLEKHRELAGLHLAPTQTRHGALGGDPPDLLGGIEPRRVAVRGVPVVALHRVLLASDHRAGNVMA